VLISFGHLLYLSGKSMMFSNWKEMEDVEQADVCLGEGLVVIFYVYFKRQMKLAGR
jgi:hypothetical protein